MSNKEQQILFIIRHQSYGMVKVDQGTFITSEGKIYDFELVQGNYHRFIPPQKQEFLQTLRTIAEQKEPSKTCDKNEIQKAYELAQQIDTKSEILLIHTGVCDYGSRTLSALINGNLVTLLQDGDVGGGVDSKEINQIKEIMSKDDVYTFKFLREFDIEKIRNDPNVRKYPCMRND